MIRARSRRTAFAAAFAAVAAVAVWSACAPASVPDRAAETPPLFQEGAVAAPEAHAARVGADVLRAGGNAVDAAIAVHFALAVTHPTAGNLGGGGFALVHVPGEGESALDYREVAPAAAHPRFFLDDAGEVVPHLSLRSHLAAGVPGSVRGMEELHRRYGTLPWASLIEPAISLAREGFPLAAKTALSFREKADELAALPPRFRELTDFPKVYTGEAGAIFRQPDLAATLTRIAEQGANEFYEGETARLIVAEMERGGGVMTMDDLAAYRPVWRTPIEGRYRGARIVSMPPPSSGGIALLQLFGMFERFPLPERHSEAHVHLVAELEKRVFADRTEHLADPDFHDVPIGELLAADYLARRAAEVDLAGKTDPARVEDGLDAEPAGAAGRESEETLHYSVVDRAGMTVAVTTTLNDSFGSAIIVDGAGFLLNNELDDFAAKAGAPNLYGVTGSTANAVEARKRPLSSMTPSIVFHDDGRPWIALGSPGGPTIFTTVFQVLVHRLDYGLSIEDAVAAPRFHHQWPPRPGQGDALFVEDDPRFALDAGVLGALAARGYQITPRKPIGDVQAVEMLAEGRVTGASDPRGIGSVERAVTSDATDSP